MQTLTAMVVIIHLTVYNVGTRIEHIGIIVPPAQNCEEILKTLVVKESAKWAGVTGRCATYEEVQ